MSSAHLHITIGALLGLDPLESPQTSPQPQIFPNGSFYPSFATPPPRIDIAQPEADSASLVPIDSLAPHPVHS
jgi:hypothetical protein